MLNRIMRKFNRRNKTTSRGTRKKRGGANDNLSLVKDLMKQHCGFNKDRNPTKAEIESCDGAIRDAYRVLFNIHRPAGLSRLKAISMVQEGVQVPWILENNLIEKLQILNNFTDLRLTLFPPLRYNSNQ